MAATSSRGGFDFELGNLEAPSRAAPLSLEGQFLTAFFAGLEAGGASGRSPIDVRANGKEFVDHYRLTLDGHAFDWGPMGYGHLVEPYEDEHPSMALMAGAQTGKTGRLIVKLTRSGFELWGSMFGYYFPDYHLPRAFSRDRFAPFIRSNPELGPWLGRDSRKKRGADAVLTRRVGASIFYFLSTAGRSATEGLPMRGVFFDEVRRMESSDIARAEERISAQRDPIDFKVSTAYMPGEDIHKFFMRGDQRYFHSACACPDGVVLSLTFPRCIADLGNATPALRRKVEHAFAHAGLPYLGMSERELAQYGEAAYLCPKCGTILTNPRDGWWEQHNPGAYTHSYQMPQLLSPSYPAGRAWQKYHRPTEVVDLQYIWNDMVGLPYLDPSAQPVTWSDMLGCVNTELKWAVHNGERWIRENVVNAAMGFDVQQGYNVAVIKALAPNGKFRTLHVEIVHGSDPFEECARLMERFNVRCCVFDAQPEFNEAFRFAKAFEGRAWLCYYVEGERTEMVDWKDRPKHKAGQKGDEVRFKYTVTVNRTKGLEWSLKRWAEGLNELPHPDRLVQSLPRQGGKAMLTSGLRVGAWGPTAIARELYLAHQLHVAIVKTYADDDAMKIGKMTIRAEHVGGVDPHFAHAELYANIALARVGQPARPRVGG